MVSGHKRWTLYHPDDADFLYPSWRRGTLAPEFPDTRELSSNSKQYPMFSQARRAVVVLGPGDVLFVPGGTPHRVENLTATVSYVKHSRIPV